MLFKDILFNKLGSKIILRVTTRILIDLLIKLTLILSRKQLQNRKILKNTRKFKQFLNRINAKSFYIYEIDKCKC